MRSWLTTREVQRMLGVTQQRVSQLVKNGELVASYDSDGRLQYDRGSVETFASERAARRASNASAAETRRVMQMEARDRLERERRRRAVEAAQRIARYESWVERIMLALERIAAKCR